MIIFFISLIITIIGLVIDSEIAGSIGMIGMIISFLIIIAIAITSDQKDKRHTKNKYIYQVRELERNTVFNITDSIGGFSAKDTVYINMSKLTIDPKDSVAMIGVIVKEIK